MKAPGEGQKVGWEGGGLLLFAPWDWVLLWVVKNKYSSPYSQYIKDFFFFFFKQQEVVFSF